MASPTKRIFLIQAGVLHEYKIWQQQFRSMKQKVRLQGYNQNIIISQK